MYQFIYFVYKIKHIKFDHFCLFFRAVLEKLILMQEQNQKTCDMDQVKAEMTQIESHLTDLHARLARGEVSVKVLFQLKINVTLTCVCFP